MGNPVIWWSNLVFLGLFVLLYIVEAVRVERRKAVVLDERKKDIDEGTWNQSRLQQVRSHRVA